jgi:hypothetical protein
MSIWDKIRRRSEAAPIEPAGRPERSSEQVAALIDRKFGGSVRTEFVPSSIKGDGMYVLTAGEDFSRGYLTEIGFSMQQTKDLKEVALAQWSVSTGLMERLVPESMEKSPAQLTHEIRAIPGHEYSTVQRLHASNGDFIVAVNRKTRRSTFARGIDAVNEVITKDIPVKQILVPERQMHNVFTLEEGQSRS